MMTRKRLDEILMLRGALTSLRIVPQKEGYDIQVRGGQTVAKVERFADAMFFAQSPDIVLELITEVERLQTRLSQYEKEYLIEIATVEYGARFEIETSTEADLAARPSSQLPTVGEWD